MCINAPQQPYGKSEALTFSNSAATQAALTEERFAMELLDDLDRSKRFLRKLAVKPKGAHLPASLFILRGVFIIAFGLGAALTARNDLPLLISMFVLCLAIDGALAAGIAGGFPKLETGCIALAIQAVIDIGLVVTLFLDPDVSPAIAVTIGGIWAVVSGALTLVLLFYCDEISQPVWAATGIATVMAGLLLMDPNSVSALPQWLGTFALVYGLSFILLGWRLWQGLSGVSKPRAGQ
jgi:uncharacterized membrane protein HdeD (DUF308 family)